MIHNAVIYPGICDYSFRGSVYKELYSYFMWGVSKRVRERSEMGEAMSVDLLWID